MVQNRKKRKVNRDAMVEKRGIIIIGKREKELERKDE